MNFRLYYANEYFSWYMQMSHLNNFAGMHWSPNDFRSKVNWNFKYFRKTVRSVGPSDSPGSCFLDLECTSATSVKPTFGSVLGSAGGIIHVSQMKLVEVFVSNTKLSFVTFLYKISIEVSLKNKVASSWNWTHNWPPLVYKFYAYPIVLMDRRKARMLDEFVKMWPFYAYIFWLLYWSFEQHWPTGQKRDWTILLLETMYISITLPLRFLDPKLINEYSRGRAYLCSINIFIEDSGSVNSCWYQRMH